MARQKKEKAVKTEVKENPKPEKQKPEPEKK